MSCYVLIFSAVLSTWFDVDDVAPEPKPDIVPVPVVEGCQCGCGKMECKCGKAAGVGCTAPMLSIDETALNALAPQHKEKLIVYRMPNCPACDRLERDGHGDADVSIEHAGKQAPFPVTAYPIIFSPRTGQYLTGYASIQQIRLWLKLPAVKASPLAVGAVTVGKIDGKALREFQAKIPADGVIKFDGASITIPKSMATQIDVTPDRQAIKFTGSKPRLTYGSGWLAVSQAVNGIFVTRDLLTIGLDGFPDICLRVE